MSDLRNEVFARVCGAMAKQLDDALKDAITFGLGGIEWKMDDLNGRLHAVSVGEEATYYLDAIPLIKTMPIKMVCTGDKCSAEREIIKLYNLPDARLDWRKQ